MIAHGTGTSAINGHPGSWLEGIRLDNVRLFVSHDPRGPYDNTRAAMSLRYARDFTMKDVEINWEGPHYRTWTAGLQADSVTGLLLDGSKVPARLVLRNAENVTVRHSRTPAIQVSGSHSRGIRLLDTEATVATDSDVAKSAILKQ